MNDTPLVTVSLITYNHERFIEQAINSILDQVTDFPFELVIGEDDSSDNTRQIVRRYAAEHPERIRLHLHSRSSNISYGGKPTSRHNFANNLCSARGKYIALLDGDDYWTTPHKLQLQVDYLEKTPGCATCFGRSEVVDENGAIIDIPIALPAIQPPFSLTDFLRLSFVPRTCTVMFRRGLFGDFPDWYFKCPVSDFPLHALNGQHGDFGFIDHFLAAYRIHPGGLWSMGWTPVEWNEGDRDQQQRIANRWGAFINMYEFLGDHLRENYRPVIRQKIAEFARSQARAYLNLEDWPSARRSAWKALSSDKFGDSLRTNLQLLFKSYGGGPHQ